MAADIVIVWPDPRGAGKLHSALLRASAKSSIQILAHYPSAGEMTTLLRDDEGETKIVIIGFTDEQRAVQTIHNARNAVPGVGLIAADLAESTGGLRAAMRAGASDYWTPPFDPTELARTLVEIFPAGQSDVDGRLVAFLPGQPGDGASTAALHFAEAISAGSKHPTLLIDCDLQCGTLGFRLGLRPDFTLLDAFGQGANLDDIWDRLATPWNSIRLLTAPENSFGLTGEHLEALPQIIESALRNFAFVVVDFPAALYRPCAGALRRADEICVVCAPEITSLHLTRRRFSDLNEWDVRADKVNLIVNRADSRNAAPVSELERSLSSAVRWQLPNSYETISRAALDGCTVGHDTPYGQAISKIAAEVAGFKLESHRGGWRKLLSFS